MYIADNVAVLSLNSKAAGKQFRQKVCNRKREREVVRRLEKTEREKERGRERE